MPESYCPDRGDIVWLLFSPQRGREQTGERPALTLSPQSYNRKTGLGIFCPVTSQVKGYPFEVPIPEGLKVQGVVLSDHVKSLDWRSRNARFFCRAPLSVLSETIEKLHSFLESGNH